MADQSITAAPTCADPFGCDPAFGCASNPGRCCKRPIATVGALLEALPIVEYRLHDEWCQQSAGRIRRWRDAGPGHPLHGWGPWRDMGVVARDDDHLPGRLVPADQAESDPNGRGLVTP